MNQRAIADPNRDMGSVPWRRRVLTTVFGGAAAMVGGVVGLRVADAAKLRAAGAACAAKLYMVDGDDCGANCASCRCRLDARTRSH